MKQQLLSVLIFALCMTMSACAPNPSARGSYPIEPSGSPVPESSFVFPTSPVATATESHGAEIPGSASEKRLSLSDLVEISAQVRAENPGKSPQELQALIFEKMQKRKFGTKSTFQTKGIVINDVYISDPEIVALLSRPDLVLATIDVYAHTIDETNETYTHFSDFHNNEADAYRHGIWNIALAEYAIEGGIDIDLTKGLGWAKTFSDAHEAGAPGPELETAMDLHNNRVGRLFIRDHYSKYNDIESLFYDFRNTVQTQKVGSVDQINTAGEKVLVYIKN